MNRAHRLLAWVRVHSFGILQDAAATVSLMSIGYGFWLAWEPLGFIIPGVVVLGCLVWSRVREARQYDH